MQLRHVSTNLRQGLRRNMSMHAAVILTLFVSLTLVGVGVLLNKQAELTTEVIGNELQVTVTLCVPEEPRFPQCTSEVTAEQEAAIIDVIEQNPEVEGFTTVSKQEGLDNLRRRGIAGDSNRLAGSGKDGFRPRKECHPGICQSDAARITQKQGDAEFTLQVADLHGKRRLRDIQARGRATEVQGFSNRKEITQMAKLHRSGFYR